MTDPRRILAELALGIGLLAPSALAQKPLPAPSPPPSSPPPNSSGTTVPSSPQPVQSNLNYVMFLYGRVATDDGTPVPQDVSVEVVCNEKVRQQAYATSNGDFSMQMGSRSASVLDASDHAASQKADPTNSSSVGIPSHEFARCELRAKAAGFRSTSRSLMDLTSSAQSVDVGSIVMERVTKMKGATISAAPYNAPSNARKAYAKGLHAERIGKFADARKYFEQAVGMSPRYGSAWFRLGTVLEKENEKDSARAAYIKASAIDPRFLPPYLSLASMAYEAQDWTSVLLFTGHVMALDPLEYGDENVYVADLDEWNLADAYFYNAVANYKLNNIEAAEKSALKAEHVDLLTRNPLLHLLLAEIFTQAKDYALARAELQTFLELYPHAREGDLVREQMAKLEKLSHSAPSIEKPVQN